ncbi:MAG: hypothetical protein IPL53_03490 [Ignavibacteria bacterium]|nr:hypothetical protein [Ignavibacteria bacterium]
MYKIIFTFSAILVLISSSSFAQRSTSNRDFGLLKKYSNKPSIEVSYGLSNITLNGNDYGLADAGMLEMKLGFTRENQSRYGSDILNYKNRFLFLSNASSDNYSKSNNPGTENDLWRFGFGNKEGYGIKLGSVSIMPYSSNSLAWSELSYPVSDESVSDNSALADFNNAFRFGTTTEAGINLQLAPGFSIQPKYEISDIFPRHLFGKQLMSSVIEISGLFAIDGFTNSIMKNAPVAGTIVSFVLKNAYEYGFYQLRKNQMNWPFTSVAPLRYSTFKLGMTFTF